MKEINWVTAFPRRGFLRELFKNDYLNYNKLWSEGYAFKTSKNNIEINTEK